MVICGLKLTHDAAIALIDDGKLIFSYEMEKINNNPRHAEFRLNEAETETIFNTYGYSSESIDSLVIDGWSEGYTYKLKGTNKQALLLTFNGYDPLTGHKPVLDVQSFDPGDDFPEYKSPFSSSLTSSFILAGDGAIGAQLYYREEKVVFSH